MNDEYLLTRHVLKLIPEMSYYLLDRMVLAGVLNPVRLSERKKLYPRREVEALVKQRFGETHVLPTTEQEPSKRRPKRAKKPKGKRNVTR